MRSWSTASAIAAGLLIASHVLVRAQGVKPSAYDIPFDQLTCRDLVVSETTSSPLIIWLGGRSLAAIENLSTERVEGMPDLPLSVFTEGFKRNCSRSPDDRAADVFVRVINSVVPPARLDRQLIDSFLSSRCDRLMLPDAVAIRILLFDGYRSVQRPTRLTLRKVSPGSMDSMFSMFAEPCTQGSDKPLLTLFDEWSERSYR